MPEGTQVWSARRAAWYCEILFQFCPVGVELDIGDLGVLDSMLGIMFSLVAIELTKMNIANEMWMCSTSSQVLNSLLQDFITRDPCPSTYWCGDVGHDSRLA